ncbi:MFS transporter [Dolosigranulum pigrum]|uniref:MFS transporter n=1 Tax=Dolosigranulum pigrum TaxID=29394 RepID=UPI00163C44E4|nr:MFS transporter [Dolosigranulum pigrum]QTJ53456.1 MFS transporter [Dolosigranulum pigrum]
MKQKSWKHWLILVIFCGVAMSGVGITVHSSGVFITPIAEELSLYRGTVAMHNTLTLIAKAVMTLYSGKLLEKFKFRNLIITGGLVAGLSNMMLGLVSHVWLFNLFGLLRGMGAGMMTWVPATVIINEWFEEKNGLAMSIMLSFSSIGGAIFSPIFTRVIEAGGWRLGYQLMGLTIILLALPAMITPYTLDPRECGYLPYGATDRSEKERNVVRRGDADDYSMSLLILMILFSTLISLFISLPQHFPGFAMSIGLTSEFGATMLSTTLITSFIFKILMGYISDQIGSVYSTYSILLLILASGFLLLFYQESQMALYIAAGLVGGVFAIPSVCIVLLTKRFFGHYHFTTLYPIISFAISMGGSISISAIGFIYDFTGTYTPAFVMMMVVALINSAVLFYCTQTKKALTSQ